MAEFSQLENSGDPQDDVPALEGGNWRHYVDATKVIHEFLDRESDDSPSVDTDPDGNQSVPARNLHPPAENTWKPEGDYLCFYCDLLGFSEEMRTEGTDSLPDFYGAAYLAAAYHPSTKVYLLSDSFIAFAPAVDAAEFIQAVQSAVANWRADGLVPQCSIGYGTFVERRPEFAGIPDNFFGVQIAGTALVDAVAIQKQKPPGSRILISSSAENKLTNMPSVTLVNDPQGDVEMFLERNPRSDLFDCLYYIMCLRDRQRDRQPDARIYQHYIWSIASRAVSGGDLLLRGAFNLCRPHWTEAELGAAYDAVQTILGGYQRPT